MADEIIRAGDKTSHGGTVIEGSQRDICMGKPIAFIGHMTFCPQCKGGFPIIEGVMNATFYGKGVAVAGMKTACGAVLIASQFTDRVQRRSGAGIATRADTSNNATPKQPVAASEPKSTIGENDDVKTEHFYSLLDEAGNPVEDYRYDVRIADKVHTKANSYKAGDSVTISGTEDTILVTWLSTDSGLRS